jgi:hypothetical protein
MPWRKILVRTGVVMLVVFAAMQLVPYGWTHANPPVTQTATWPDAETEDLARAACYDCHSNETEWPPYSYVAPMSWLTRSDVESGRDALNLSELDQDGGKELDEAAEKIADGSMPPSKYRMLHPGARLSDAEEQRLIEAFQLLEGGEDNSGHGNAEDRGGGEDEDNRGPG